ncbi:hypothetical protein FACS1894182_13450 [Bacteroidia bacterium]|nr:hypothetical protein FACS1894182_13450 [Bacteroidia bacterium]
MVSPKILDSVLNVNSYNIGINAYGFDMQYVQYKIFEKYNKVPRLIIQNVDYISTLFGRKDAYHKHQFLPYLQEDLLKRKLKTLGLSDWELYFPAFQYHSDLLSIYRGWIEFLGIKHYAGAEYKGYVGTEIPWNGAELEKILSKDSLVSSTDPEIIQLFDSFLSDCKSKNIQVILVFTPIYFKAAEFIKNKEEVMDIFRCFSQKYDIPFLDYSRDSLCYDTAYFYNAWHLNKEATELFSLQLANDIKALQLNLSNSY